MFLFTLLIFFQNSPLSSFAREPLFKPHEFYAAKKNSKGTEQSIAVPVGARPSQVSNGTQTPPDVTISDERDGVNARSTPDLLRQATDAQHSGSAAVHAHRNPYDDDIVTHLRSRKRGESAKRKPKIRLESEDSVSGTLSNELEDDNYIPEVIWGYASRISFSYKAASRHFPLET